MASAKREAMRAARAQREAENFAIDRSGTKPRAPGGTRTPSLLVRSQTLYPFELRARVLHNDVPTAEEAGFEPARELSPPTRLAGGRTRPSYATPPRFAILSG